ncbi:hypothetical protein MTR67_024470 [Solanum verrucosum]|uniref:Prohibitin n=1 Tax=Solanum verrucosum TaxID=315347 RepID=A0AAF0QYG2_SOLVR|nr:hypothetical protein MTR67_024470 [Solanum verrucosum]
MGSNQAALSFLKYLAIGAARIDAGAATLSSSLYIVDDGQRAVLFDRFKGIIDDVVGEGTHFLVPWGQKPFIFDIRTKPHTFSCFSGTKDLQMVHLTLRVLSRPEVLRLPKIFKTLGLEDFDIELNDVAITHLSYGAEFSKAVEKKQVAQQEAEWSKFVVMKAEQE